MATRKKISLPYKRFGIRSIRTLKYGAFRFWWLYLLLFAGLVYLFFEFCNAPKSLLDRSKLRQTDSLQQSIHEHMNRCCECESGLVAVDSTQTDDEFDERREEAGGQTGKLTITLLWNSIADLDLHVTEHPGDHIFFDHRKSNSTGGELDVDMNAESKSAQPIENVYYPEIPPSGSYEIAVHYYSTNSAPAVPVPFEVRVDYNGTIQYFQGIVNREKDFILVHKLIIP
jgi:hypothetical protein